MCIVHTHTEEKQRFSQMSLVLRSFFLSNTVHLCPFGEYHCGTSSVCACVFHCKTFVSWLKHHSLDAIYSILSFDKARAKENEWVKWNLYKWMSCRWCENCVFFSLFKKKSKESNSTASSGARPFYERRRMMLFVGKFKRQQKNG